MEQVNKTLGSVRLEYLDNATKLMGVGDVEGAIKHMDMFNLTIKDMHPASEEIQKAFDKAMKDKDTSMENQKKEIDKLLTDQKINSWEHSDMVQDSKVKCTLQEINDRLNELWQISLKHGLFNE